VKPDHWVKIVLCLLSFIGGMATAMWQIHDQLADLRVEVAEVRAAILSTASHVIPTGPPLPKEETE
jgi:hypothetical protein